MMVRLKDLENDDELAGGLMERRAIEQCRPLCSDCKRYVGEWTDYDKALEIFIDHRYQEHRVDKPVIR